MNTLGAAADRRVAGTGGSHEESGALPTYVNTCRESRPQRLFRAALKTSAPQGGGERKSNDAGALPSAAAGGDSAHGQGLTCNRHFGAKASYAARIAPA